MLYKRECIVYPMAPMAAILLESLGWVGMVLILAAYAMSSAGRVSLRPVLYQSLNLTGAVCIVINCLFKQAWAVVALDSIWALIAAVALLRMKTAAASPT